MKLGSMLRYTGSEQLKETNEKPLSESNPQRFSKLYKVEISKAQKNNCDVNRNLSVLPVEDHYP